MNERERLIKQADKLWAKEAYWQERAMAAYWKIKIFDRGNYEEGDVVTDNKRDHRYLIDQILLGKSAKDEFGHRRTNCVTARRILKKGNLGVVRWFEPDQLLKT